MVGLRIIGLLGLLVLLSFSNVSTETLAISSEEVAPQSEEPVFINLNWTQGYDLSQLSIDSPTITFERPINFPRINEVTLLRIRCQAFKDDSKSLKQVEMRVYGNSTVLGYRIFEGDFAQWTEIGVRLALTESKKIQKLDLIVKLSLTAVSSVSRELTGHFLLVDNAEVVSYPSVLLSKINYKPIPVLVREAGFYLSKYSSDEEFLTECFLNYLDSVGEVSFKIEIGLYDKESDEIPGFLDSGSADVRLELPSENFLPNTLLNLNAVPFGKTDNGSFEVALNEFYRLNKTSGLSFLQIDISLDPRFQTIWKTIRVEILQLEAIFSLETEHNYPDQNLTVGVIPPKVPWIMENLVRFGSLICPLAVLTVTLKRRTREDQSPLSKFRMEISEDL